MAAQGNDSSDKHGDFDPDSLSVAAALQRILTQVPELEGDEELELRQALGRILSRPVVSRVNVPAHRNSAMDGYAIRSLDLGAHGMTELRVVGTALAGHPYSGTVVSGEAVRIMTGAVIPDGADCVVMQEQVVRDGECVRIAGAQHAGQHVREAGEDIQAGSSVLDQGRLLVPADLGLIASLGIGTVQCRKPVRVAFFSTGDEIRSAGETLGPGEIYDSNRYSLFGMLSRLPVVIRDLGVIADRPAELRLTLLDAAASADVILTSGGVSVGEADYIKALLAELGTINFWKVAMKPGRPLAFGRIGDAVFFGLPGNPVSVMVTFYLFVQPALLRMLGCTRPEAPTLPARTSASIKKRPGRTELQRGILSSDSDGSLLVAPTGEQGSGILSSMSNADCFIILPAECGNVEPGATVQVQPFYGFV